jgi:hypothetical protein
MVEACRGVRGPGGKNGAQTVVSEREIHFRRRPREASVGREKNQAGQAKNLRGARRVSRKATRVRFRDSRFLVYFALDSRRKSFRRRQNNATFLAIESEACATSTRAGVLCGVSRRSRTMSLTNVTEDLSGLSRAELVYKAKLAEQAERCVRPLLVSISAFPPSRVACGRRTEENLSVWRAGPYILRSDLGSGEPSAPPRSHGTTRVSFASPSPAAPRIEPRARLAGPDLARDHTVSSRIARIVNSNRDTSSSAAHGDDAGGLARGRRARYPRSRSRHSHEAALSPAEARQPPPAAEFDTARRCPLAAPLDWAHGDQSTRVTSVSFRVFFVRVVFLVVVVVVVRFRPSRLTDSPTPPDHTLVVISTSRTSLSNKQLRRDDGVHVQGG